MNDSQDLRTVGVEEELLLVDPQTGLPTAIIEPVLLTANLQKGKKTDPPERVQLESEVKQEMIEIVSPPRKTIDGIYETIVNGRRIADEAAKNFDVRAVALGTSALAVNSNLADDPRFEAMKKQFGLTLREQLTCGFHVHVDVHDAEEAVAVLDRIRPWLPALLALSTNSPMWAGRDTGFASYRYQAWLRWPTAGAYDIFGGADAYQKTVDSLISTGVLLDQGMVYFDARLCERYPTVEVRISDVCLEAEHAAALAAIVRALVETAASEWRAGIEPRDVPSALLNLAAWSASRFGVQESLVSPVSDRQVDAMVAIEELLEHVSHELTAAGDIARVETAIEDIFTNGSGSVRQREVMQETRDARAIVSDAIRITNQVATQKV